MLRRPRSRRAPFPRGSRLHTCSEFAALSARSRLVALQPVPVHQAVKRGAVDARAPRGLRQVAAGMCDRARQEPPIELLEEPTPGIVIAVVRPRAGCVLQAETPVAGRGRYTKERRSEER